MSRRMSRSLIISILALAALPLCSIPNIFDMTHDATQTAQMMTDRAYWDEELNETSTAAAATLRAQHPDTPEATSTQSVMSLVITNTPRTKRPPTKTPTPTPSPATVRVNEATNCRTGPSIAYDIVTSFEPGQTLEIVGKNARTNCWVVKIPGRGNCWLWGQYATVVGNTRTLPEMKPPPSPTPTKSAPLIPIRPTDTPYSP